MLRGLALKYYFTYLKGKEDQGASNFYLDIEPYHSYHDDPKEEAFWTEFAKGEG